MSDQVEESTLPPPVPPCEPDEQLVATTRAELAALRRVAEAAKAWSRDEESQGAAERSRRSFELLCAVDDLLAAERAASTSILACARLRQDCEVCREKSLDVRCVDLVEHRHNLLRAWHAALYVRLDCVDDLLPDPTLFQMILGRRRWHQVRDEARRILLEEYQRGWVALMDSRTFGELIVALGSRGPIEAAQAAIDAAKEVE